MDAFHSGLDDKGWHRLVNTNDKSSAYAAYAVESDGSGDIVNVSASTDDSGLTDGGLQVTVTG